MRARAYLGALRRYNSRSAGRGCVSDRRRYGRDGKLRVTCDCLQAKMSRAVLREWRRSSFRGNLDDQPLVMRILRTIITQFLGLNQGLEPQSNPKSVSQLKLLIKTKPSKWNSVPIADRRQRSHRHKIVGCQEAHGLRAPAASRNGTRRRSAPDEYGSPNRIAAAQRA